MSTTLLWQKHAARKSTPPALGTMRLVRAVTSGKNAIIRYCSRPSGRSGFMYTPPVASLACCSSTVSPANFKISIGIRFLCAAKMEFMTGMYWLARSPDTDTMRMRDVRGTRSTCVFSESASAARDVLSAEAAVGACRIVCLLMWVRAIERAPPMSVVGVASRWLSFVSLSSLAKLRRMALSTTANGRYLFALSAMWPSLSFPCPFVCACPFVSPLRT